MQLDKIPHISPMNKFTIPVTSLIANRVAKKFGSNRATKIVLMDGEHMQLAAVRGTAKFPRVIKYDSYHAESRTGIRASMAALKRF